MEGQRCPSLLPWSLIGAIEVLQQIENSKVEVEEQVEEEGEE